MRSDDFLIIRPDSGWLQSEYALEKGAINVAAVFEWIGNRVASYAFVILAVIHYLLIAYNSMQFVNAGLIDDWQK